MAHHPGRALLDSKNSPLAKAVQSLALYYHRRWFFPIFLRAGASCDRGFLDQYPYFRKVRNAGGIKAYEKAHLKRLVAMLVHKFPQLPAAVHPRIVIHWAHVGDY